MVKQINKFLFLSYEPELPMSRVNKIENSCLVALNIKSMKEIFPFELLFFLSFFFEIDVFNF